MNRRMKEPKYILKNGCMQEQESFITRFLYNLFFAVVLLTCIAVAILSFAVGIWICKLNIAVGVIYFVIVLTLLITLNEEE